MPTGTFPKLTLPGVSASPACTPEPLIAITELGPCELMTVTFPVTVSEVLGLKATVKIKFCEGVRLTGTLAPLSVNPVPLMLICEI